MCFFLLCETRSLSSWSLDFAQRVHYRSRCRESILSERTKVIKTAVHDSRHDLSSIGMQASRTEILAFDIEATPRHESESQRPRQHNFNPYDRKASVLLFHQRL